MAAGTEPPSTPSPEDRVAALEATVAMFARKLLERGDISVNDARAVHGLPAFRFAEAEMAATDIAALQDRIAALEEHIRYPLRMYVPKWEPLTEAEEAEVRESAAEAFRRGPMPYRITAERPPLTRDEIRQILRECVTVVKPGETLVVRGANWTPNQTREIQQIMDEIRELGIVPFKVLAVIGDEMGVAEARP